MVAETLTFTPTPTFATVLNYAIQNCIDAQVWHWSETNSNPPRDEANPNCLNLISDKWRFEAQKRDLLDERQGLRINFNTLVATNKGIYFDFSNYRELKLRLLVEIDELTVNEQCGIRRYCDADLVIGFGDPRDTGWFLIYRATTINSNRLVCFLSTVKQECYPTVFNEPTPHRIPREYEVLFSVNGLDYSATIDDVHVFRSNLQSNKKIFWIGYHFRSRGSIKAFIEFLDPAK